MFDKIGRLFTRKKAKAFIFGRFKNQGDKFLSYEALHVQVQDPQGNSNSQKHRLRRQHINPERPSSGSRHPALRESACMGHQQWQAFRNIRTRRKKRRDLH